MKLVEVTAPKDSREELEEIVQEYDEDASVSEVERDGKPFVKLEVSIDSGDIDEMTEELKSVTEVKSGELTINVLEETASIEKGVRREGGTWALSVQEMYSKAFSFSVFDKASWALIGLASIIAVFGVVTENVMLVIGAMVIAPMLGPFIAVSFGLVIGDPKIIRESFIYGTLSIFLAILVAFIAGIPVPVRPNPLMRLIAEPGFATIPLSLAVGAAASLTFMTEARENLAGIAVAIALVPPSAVAGLALAIENYAVLFDVSLVIVSNVTALILAGSVTFKLFGVTPSTEYRKKVSEQQLRRALLISIVAIVITGAIVGYISFNDFQNSAAEATVNEYLEAEMGDRLLQENVDVTTERVTVRIVVVDPQLTEAALQQELRERTGRRVDLTMIGVRGVER